MVAKGSKKYGLMSERQCPSIPKLDMAWDCNIMYVYSITQSSLEGCVWGWMLMIAFHGQRCWCPPPPTHFSFVINPELVRRVETIIEKTRGYVKKTKIDF